jgi:hypothetical protein
MIHRRLVLAIVLVAVAPGSVGCTTDNTATTGSTVLFGDPSIVTEPSSASTSTTNNDSSPSSPSSAEPQGPTGDVTVAVYWTRSYGLERPIGIPGYRDPDGGPFPFVLYGSVTNVGDAPLVDPQISVDWIDSTSSAPLHTMVVRPIDPFGQPIGELAPGASADLVVVVDDEEIASQLPDAIASFEVLEP